MLPIQEMKNHQMNAEELNIWEKMLEEVEELFKLMQIPNEYKYMAENILKPQEYRGYSEEYGYYIVTQDWRNDILVLQTNDKEEIIYYYLSCIAISIGSDIELKNRKNYEQEWRYTKYDYKLKKWIENDSNWIYHTNYDGRKYRFEFELKMLQKVGKETLLEKRIRERLKDMNSDFKETHWLFDKEQICFVENNLQEYKMQIEGLPTFKFYFRLDMGNCKRINNVFELRDDKKQNIRVMLSKCESEEELEVSAKIWIKRNKEILDMEEVEYRKDKIKNIPIEVYILKFIDKPNVPERVYKIGYMNGAKITISGPIYNENVISKAFERIVCDFDKYDSISEKYLEVNQTQDINNEKENILDNSEIELSDFELLGE